MKNISEKQIEARVKDIFTIARKNREKKASNFLDPGQQQIAQDVAKSFPGVELCFEGGYEEAERKILVAYPRTYEEPFKLPLGALRITTKDPDEYLGHRDYLGAILGLGISREKIGDILVGKASADIIVKEEIMEYIGLNLIKVGNAGV